VLERRGKLRGKIVARSQQDRGKITTWQTRGKYFFFYVANFASN
jgi:hypothetical protein